MLAIASSTSHTWFASIISLRSAPISSRRMRARRTSSSRFLLEMRPPLRDAFAREAPDLVVVVSKPACGCRVCGVAAREHFGFAIGFGRRAAAQHRERFVRRQRIGHVTKVQTVNERFRAHVDQQLPHRAGTTGQQSCRDSGRLSQPSTWRTLGWMAKSSSSMLLDDPTTTRCKTRSIGAARRTSSCSYLTCCGSMASTFVR
jgi:hypothetical protein